MSDGHATPVVCASWTHARRHPKVLGRIGGWSPPVQLSFPQLGVLGGSIVVLAMTWSVWAPALPPILRFLVLAGVPAGLTWAVRRSRIEGRSLVRSALGVIMLWSQPQRGTIAGRPAPSPRHAAWGRSRTWFHTTGSGQRNGS